MFVDWKNAKVGAETIEMLQDWPINQEEALPMLNVTICANDYYTSQIYCNQ